MSRSFFIGPIVALAVLVSAGPALGASGGGQQQLNGSTSCGIYAGRWSDGSFAGLFGVRENGHQVWFAKVISRDGVFVGITSQTRPQMDGVLLARVILPDRDGCSEGYLFGRWTRAETRVTAKGGRWATFPSGVIESIGTKYTMFWPFTSQTRPHTDGLLLD